MSILFSYNKHIGIYPNVKDNLFKLDSNHLSHFKLNFILSLEKNFNMDFL